MARKKNKRELYEESYKSRNHFSFGSNWKDFLRKLTPERMRLARKSLEEFLPADLSGKSFIDVGCGSGLFSLAAVRMGADVTSIDVDDSSLECARYLKKKFAKGSSWKIEKASALDARLRQFEKFDVVYSWGVLHHTGYMTKAIRNVAGLVKKGGVFYIAIYNNNTRYPLEGSSKFWCFAKSVYNRSPPIIKEAVYLAYTTYLLAGITASLRNPFSYIRNYKTVRGMDFFTDIKDWLGGYPYEYASADEMKRLFGRLGFTLVKEKRARSLGCNEFLFRKE